VLNRILGQESISDKSQETLVPLSVHQKKDKSLTPRQRESVVTSWTTLSNSPK
jgi:hypothetical protein